MSKNELLTVQQFADAAGISKQAVYKALNNKLMPYVQLVDGKKMLKNKALREIYGVEVEQPDNPSLNNPSQPMDALIAMLQKELDAKNEQISAQQKQLEAKDRQIEQLTSALDHTTSSLQAAQALHAGTMQQQLVAPDTTIATVEEVPENEGTEHKKEKGWFRFFKKNKE